FLRARSYRALRSPTATSLVSISTDPPMVLVGLERMTFTRKAVIESKAFNVSVLARAQEFIADRFAGRSPAVAAAWNDVPHHLGPYDLLLLDGFCSWLERSQAEVSR